MTVPPPPPAARIAALDLARGAAILAMAGYHACWDLCYFGLARFDLPGDRLWLAARSAILGLFLLLVGAGLTLAAARGLRWRRVASRVALIGGAALAVTLGSRWFAPDGVIYFGALHHIAVASVLGLVFLRLPGWAVLAAAAACLAAPALLAAPLFDREGLGWLGLMTTEPRSNDYVPLLPWFGLVLAGLVLARRLERMPGLAGWRPSAAAARALGWAGRHSLPLYLGHQPLLLGALWLALALGVAPAGGPVAGAKASERFHAQCRAACERSGATAGHCLAYCRCIDAGMTEEGLWPALLTERLDPAGQLRLTAIIEGCAARRRDR
ncbi:MAG: heparan-alpha-glucosaminide N-acetyltransferase [Rhodospirillaceae bacterium]